MTSTSTRIVAGLAALVAAAALSSCSSADDHNAQASSSATSAEQVAAHNVDDVAFAENMIPHHQQALELSALVPDRSTNPAVVKLATTISSEQQPEMAAMRALLLQWEVNPNDVPDHSAHAGMGMSGMVDDATMAELTSLNGPAFDTLWLQSMINHHQGAVEMAKAEIAKGQSVDMISMAKNIVTAQQAEIDQMKQMLGG